MVFQPSTSSHTTSMVCGRYTGGRVPRCCPGWEPAGTSKFKLGPDPKQQHWEPCQVKRPQTPPCDALINQPKSTGAPPYSIFPRDHTLRPWCVAGTQAGEFNGDRECELARMHNVIEKDLAKVPPKRWNTANHVTSMSGPRKCRPAMLSQTAHISRRIMVFQPSTSSHTTSMVCGRYTGGRVPRCCPGGNLPTHQSSS